MLQEARSDSLFWGRLVESCVGAYLLNEGRAHQIEVFYWREGDKEVDFILRRGESVVALEVKSGKEGLSRSGMGLFSSKYIPIVFQELVLTLLASFS